MTRGKGCSMPRFDKSTNQLVDKSHTCSDLTRDTDTYNEFCRYVYNRRQAAQSLMNYAGKLTSKAVARDMELACRSELSLLKVVQLTADTWYNMRKKGKHA